MQPRPLASKCVSALVIVAALFFPCHTLADIGDFILGQNPGDDETYALNAGDLQEVLHNAYIGYGGKGTFDHTGGELWVSNDAFLGYEATGEGVYEFHTGTLSVSELRVGWAGVGEFTQYGGDVDIRNKGGFSVGDGVSGDYIMKGGSISSGDLSQPTSSSSGIRVDHDGLFRLELGDVQLAGSMIITQGGTCEVAGGTLAAGGNLHVGGQLLVSAGVLTSGNDFFLGRVRDLMGFPITEEPGVLTLTGGRVEAADKDFLISEHSYITDATAVGTAGTLVAGERFINDSTQRFLYSTVRTTVHCDGRPFGGNWAVYAGDVTDKGAVPEGLDDNFAIGTFVLGEGDGGDMAEFTLSSDMYVYELQILNDASIDLGGHTIYYLEEGAWHNGIWGGGFTYEGHYQNGQVVGITPEPATLALLAVGGIALAVAGRRR